MIAVNIINVIRHNSHDVKSDQIYENITYDNVWV